MNTKYINFLILAISIVTIFNCNNDKLEIVDVPFYTPLEDSTYSKPKITLTATAKEGIATDTSITFDNEISPITFTLNIQADSGLASYGYTLEVLSSLREDSLINVSFIIDKDNPNTLQTDIIITPRYSKNNQLLFYAYDKNNQLTTAPFIVNTPVPPPPTLKISETSTSNFNATKDTLFLEYPLSTKEIQLTLEANSPVELVRIEGNGETFAYTNGELEVTQEVTIEIKPLEEQNIEYVLTNIDEGRDTLKFFIAAPLFIGDFIQDTTRSATYLDQDNPVFIDCPNSQPSTPANIKEAYVIPITTDLATTEFAIKTTFHPKKGNKNTPALTYPDDVIKFASKGGFSSPTEPSLKLRNFRAKHGGRFLIGFLDKVIPPHIVENLQAGRSVLKIDVFANTVDTEINEDFGITRNTDYDIHILWGDRNTYRDNTGGEGIKGVAVDFKGKITTGNEDTRWETIEMKAGEGYSGVNNSSVNVNIMGIYPGYNNADENQYSYAWYCIRNLRIEYKR